MTKLVLPRTIESILSNPEAKGTRRLTQGGMTFHSDDETDRVSKVKRIGFMKAITRSRKRKGYTGSEDALSQEEYAISFG